MVSKEFSDNIKNHGYKLKRLLVEYELLTKKQKDIFFNKAIQTSSSAIALIEHGSKYLTAKQIKKAFDKAMEDEDYGAISLLERCDKYLHPKLIMIACSKSLKIINKILEE